MITPLSALNPDVLHLAETAPERAAELKTALGDRVQRSNPCDVLDGPCACGAWHTPSPLTGAALLCAAATRETRGGR